MASFQSSLGEPGIAEELAESQRSISIAEFFEKNKHMLGFDSGARALVTAVKEAVDNALDATEEAGILPDIYVEITEQGEYYRVVVEDNGPGITKESLPKVFGKLLYGSRFHVREQNRGQQGIGISAAVLYSQLTSGKPARITSRPKGAATARYYELIIDTDENEPEIKVERETSWDRAHGTRIELEMEANMRARRQLHDYIKHTAVVNPHARIELREPEEQFRFDRVTDQLPDETEEIRPHPHGVELGTVLKMLEATNSRTISGFLQEEFTRVGRKTAEDVIDAFRDSHFGREMTWSVRELPRDDVEDAVTGATANKGRAATETFARDISSRVGKRTRLSHGQLRSMIEEAATVAEEEHGRSFGATVQENATAAVWATVTGLDPDGPADAESTDRSTPAGLIDDIHALVDEATSARKDDAAVRNFADRLAGMFADLEDARHRLTEDDLSGFIERAASLTADHDDVSFGETARENVHDVIWEVMVTVDDDPPSVRALERDRDAASDLLSGMRSVSIMAPPTRCLAPITAELVEEGLRKEYQAAFYSAVTRDAEVSGGDPFIVEAGIAYGGELPEEGSADVLRFANRVPLVYQRGACATTDVVKRIDWRNYGLDQPGGSGIPQGPAVIAVYVASTNVPFTSESKDAVANVPEIEDEIELAIREAARDLKSFLNKRRSMEKRRQKQSVLGAILPEMATKVSEVVDRPEPNIDDALARIMNNVRVERTVEDNGDRRSVTLRVSNFSTRGESLEVTEIVDREPGDLPPAVSAVEVDGEWFLSWEPEVPGAESASIEYTVDADATFDIEVEGVAPEKLTVSS